MAQELRNQVQGPELVARGSPGAATECATPFQRRGHINLLIKKQLDQELPCPERWSSWPPGRGSPENHQLSCHFLPLSTVRLTTHCNVPYQGEGLHKEVSQQPRNQLGAVRTVCQLDQGHSAAFWVFCEETRLAQGTSLGWSVQHHMTS